MSKINEIQKAIMQLDGAAFQKLGDCYFFKQGLGKIEAIGSVAGKNKTKTGTPDTLFKTPDNRFIMIEYSTQADGLVKKITDDLTKCFDQNKTGVPISSIERIILCYSSNISKKDQNYLSSIGEDKGVLIDFIDLDNLSFELFINHPNFVQDHLGIEVDSGQILSLDDFLNSYHKNKLATPLDISFFGRESQKEDILEELDNHDIIVLSGSAGVGKTRLAIECFKEFLGNNKNYQGYCIKNKGIQIYQDLKDYFSKSGRYIIFIDDANTLNQFNLLIDFLLDKTEQHSFKIIVTVRDYAKHKVIEEAKKCTYSEFHISSLSDSDICKILEDKYQITNTLWTERITSISKGNPRLAVMLALSAIKRQSVTSLRNVADVYNEYFSPIILHTGLNSDEKLLRVAASIAFFKHIDKTNVKQLSLATKLANVDERVFWGKAQVLHELELADLHSDELVKISDQILATYLCYLVFFKKKLIPFSEILGDSVFPAFVRQMKDMVFPIVSHFNEPQIRSTIEQYLNPMWQTESTNKDCRKFNALMNCFWFLKADDILCYYDEWIKFLPSESANFIDFNNNRQGEISELDNLFQLRFLGENEYKASLILFLDYAEKQQNKANNILHQLVAKYGFMSDSHHYNYVQQHVLIDELLSRINDGKNIFFSKLFIEIASEFLKVNFQVTESGRGNTFSIIQFSILDCDAIKTLREKILIHLKTLSLFSNDYKNTIIHKLDYNYQSGFEGKQHSVAKTDSIFLLDFITEDLLPNDLSHCVFVNRYLQFLDKQKVRYPAELKSKFNTPLFTMVDCFVNSHNLNFNYNDVGNYQIKSVKEFIENFTVENFIRTYTQLSEYYILSGEWEIHNCKDILLTCLIDKLTPIDLIEFIQEVTKEYELEPYKFFPILIEKIGKEKTKKVIESLPIQQKDRWLFFFFQSVPESELTLYDADEFLSYITFVEHFGYLEANCLLSYEKVRPNFIVSFLETILSKYKSGRLNSETLGSIFHSTPEVYNQLISHCKGKEFLLSETYLITNKISKIDYDGCIFSILIDNDPLFIDRYVESRFDKNGIFQGSHFDSDWSFLWLRNDYSKLIESLINKFLQNDKIYFITSPIEHLFVHHQERYKKKEVIERQNLFLENMIKHNSNDENLMKALFLAISYFDCNDRVSFYKMFLDHNDNIDDFKKLSLEPSSRTWSGSLVPILEKEKAFLEKIKSYCIKKRLFEHNRYLQSLISHKQQHTHDEIKRDFIDDF